MVAAAAYRENINEYDDDDDENTMNIYSSPPVAPLYLDTNIINDNMNGQINIDLNDVLLKSDLLLQRLNSTVSRMSLEEYDICVDIEDEQDLLHEQLPLDTFENLMREIQHDYA
jgi:hypothetical protein